MSMRTWNVLDLKNVALRCSDCDLVSERTKLFFNFYNYSYLSLTSEYTYMHASISLTV